MSSNLFGVFTHRRLGYSKDFSYLYLFQAVCFNKFFRYDCFYCWYNRFYGDFAGEYQKVLSPLFSCWRKVYKDDVCHTNYDVCHKRLRSDFDLTETPSVLSPQPLLKNVSNNFLRHASTESGIMRTEVYPKLRQEAQEKTSIAEIVETAEQTCESCRSLTPIMCVTRCNIWKLKNELRRLYKKMNNPGFTGNLLNALKNRRRLQILETLSNGQYSIFRLQQKLKKLGYYHSRRTITEEYVNPLVEVGLVEKNCNKYQATMLGHKLNELMEDFSDIEELLPPHSGCYEEKAIEALSESPKTYEELKLVISAESLSRVLKRLHKANLITKSNQNIYIFYFKTKRDSQKEMLSPTEKRVYANISDEGTTARKLAHETNISLRRTYKYLRKLRGKKLVFKRKRPKIYSLTKKGTQAAKVHEKISSLLLEFSKVSAEFAIKSSRVVQQIPMPDILGKRKEKPPQILVRSNA